MKQHKPVPPEMLKAFGFKRLRKKIGHWPAASHHNAELNLFYDPTQHTINQFADNLVNGICHKMAQNISDEISGERIRPKVRG
jgi:hypothetical protein